MNDGGKEVIYFLTVDVGTSSCKVAVINTTGKIISKCVLPSTIDSPKPGWAELDPYKTIDVLYNAIRGAIQTIDEKKIKGIGVSAQLGIVAVDNNGQPLGKVLTWMDKRANEQSKRIKEIIGIEKIYSITGRRIDPELAACKILWFKENQPKIYSKTYKYLTLKDFILYTLTGQFVTDCIHASYSLLYNIRQKTWHEEFFDDLDLALDKMPGVFTPEKQVGNIIEKVKKRLGLTKTIPVFNCGPDGTLAVFGAGLSKEKDAVNVTGTTDVFFTCTKNPIFDPYMRTVVNCYVNVDSWTQGGPMSLTGGCLKWFCENFGQAEQEVALQIQDSPYTLLDREAEKVSVGAENLLFIPGLTGERAPVWNANVRGVLFGLALHHGKAHIVRAILEGSAFIMRRMINVLENIGISINRISLVGGGSKSFIWQQIRADITGKQIVIPEIEEATCLGIAMIVGIGLGIYKSFEEAVQKNVKIKSIVEPIKANQVNYEQIYPQFIQLYENLKDNFDNLSKISY